MYTFTIILYDSYDINAHDVKTHDAFFFIFSLSLVFIISLQTKIFYQSVPSSASTSPGASTPGAKFRQQQPPEPPPRSTIPNAKIEIVASNNRPKKIHDLERSPDWKDTLSNFEKALSQSSCYDSDSCRSIESIVDQSVSSRAQTPPDPPQRYVRVLDNKKNMVNGVGISRNNLNNRYHQQQRSNHHYALSQNRQGHHQQRAASLHNMPNQMAGTLEKIRRLEEQVKEIPILHVQMSVLREERRILLRQLAVQKKLNSSKTVQRDIGTMCTVVTRDVGVANRQVTIF